MVVPDLGDDVGGAVPRDGPAVDDQLSHAAIVLAKAEHDVVADPFGAHASPRTRGGGTDPADAELARGA